MSRSRFPPTPAMSGEFIIKDQPMDGTDSFALPPAAISPAKGGSASRRSSRSNDHYAPVSPTSPNLNGRGSVSSRSGHAVKRSLEDFDLPPPPTRTRKIIQMKPKSPATSKSPAKPKDTKDTVQNSPDIAPTQTAPSKRKQPSATSAAGRKIARKTAHSLIERRRRSKMNEEFGTLKDMIPACRGQEMHKLAILQASIDYVNYLERCIHDLKTAGGNSLGSPPSPTSPEFYAEAMRDSTEQPQRPPSSIYSYSASASPDTMHPTAQVSDASPSFSPRTRIPSVHTLPDIASVLPSPALGPVNPTTEKLNDLGMDHEASAALLMLTRDRRGTADSINENFGSGTTLASQSEEAKAAESQRRKGMSVRDLLIS